MASQMTANTDGDIPTDVYLSFVRSLFGNRMTLRAGMIAHVVTCLLIYLKVRDPAYLVFAGLIFLIFVGRNQSFHRFDEVEFSVNDRATIARWERIYTIGVGLLALTVGCMTGYSFFFTRDNFAELASLSITMGSMVSVVGRNYGSKRIVDIISVSACAPFLIALFLRGDLFMALLGLLIIPLILTTRSMANGVREFLYDNVMAHREFAKIAGRFDTALNNMPHGLFMLDKDRRIVVANRKAVELLGLRDRVTLTGHTINAILRYGVRRTLLTEERADVVRSQLEGLLEGRKSRALLKFADDRYLEFTAKRRSNEGAVLIFENVTARIRAEEKIMHMARYDQLTGLPNRAYFAEFVEQNIRDMPDDERFALVVLDIDDFKHVNDTSGHMTGDRLLCALSARLTGLADDTMTLARFGGDEFVIFVRKVKDEAHVDQLMTELFDSLRGTYLINGNRLFVSLSAGVVVATKSESRLDHLHIKADLALYETKHNNKNGWTIFAEDMDEKYTRLQKMKAALRDAIRTKSFSVVYQPMFAAGTMTVASCEALSRWYHPEFGSVSPATYIPLAEEMGVVGELTRHMLNVACRDCANWGDDVGVSVNLSANDLRNEDVVDMVEGALKASGLEASRLQLEVTESAFVQDMSEAKRVLEKLREKGVVIAIDDFGTGYSSLSYLHLLPLNKVKIDRSFVSDITGNEQTFKLLKGIVHLSRELGMEVVIEGVETEEQLQLIRNSNCAEFVQGFFFGVPVPYGSIAELISSISGRDRTQLAPAEAALAEDKRHSVE